MATKQFDEVVVPLANGRFLKSSSEVYLAGDYVRLCDKDGRELAYWDSAEWRRSPKQVVGAILCACIADVQAFTKEVSNGKVRDPNPGPGK